MSWPASSLWPARRWRRWAISRNGLPAHPGKAQDHAWRSIRLLGIRIDDVPIDGIIQYMDAVLDSGTKAVVANVNIQAMNLAFQNAWLRSFFNRSELVFCDGYGVLLGAFLAGQSLAYRNTPTDWIDDLCTSAARRGRRMYLLGARDSVVSKAAFRLVSLYPSLKICGFHHGYFDTRPESRETKQVIKEIQESEANILLVGMGMPLQERWISDNFDRLSANVVMPVGALFDYVSGELRRPPRWMTRHGLEWLGRLVYEPGRLWRRYLLGNPLFVWRVLTQRAIERSAEGG